MKIILTLLLGMVFGGVAVFFWKTKNDVSQEAEAQTGKEEKGKEEEKSEKGTALSQQLERKRQENMKKLHQYLGENSRLTNNEVEELLGVSNTTAYRYLEELEQAGAIRQVGKTGQAVFYEKL